MADLAEAVDGHYTYVIVGGGIAGVTCAEHLYIIHPEASTLLITASSLIKAVTNILPVTKTLDSFDVEEREPKDLENQCPNVTVVRDVVQSLNAKEQHVIIASGKKYKYERLCICSGANPKVVAAENPHVAWIRDTESVRQFQARMEGARRIVIIGNGGIATEMVYEVTGIEIIWAIKDPHMSANYIDPGAAEFLRSELSKEKTETSAPLKRKKYTVDQPGSSGIQLGGALGPDWHSGLELCGTSQRRVTLETEVEVREILEPDKFRKSGKELTKLISEEEVNWPVYVELTNGKVYGCDFIVSATGVIPNVSNFLPGNNLRLGSDGGLLVNEQLETAEKHVYAAGDACSPGWVLAPHWFQMRLWTQARQMGSYAARSMWASVEQEEIYMDFCFELFCHSTKFFGYKVILLGLFNGQGLEGKYDILLRYTKGMEYVKCVMLNGKMQGAVLIGETDLEETFENLILNQMDLSEYGEDLLDPDIDIEDYFD